MTASIIHNVSYPLSVQSTQINRNVIYTYAAVIVFFGYLVRVWMLKRMVHFRLESETATWWRNWLWFQTEHNFAVDSQLV